MNVYLYTSYHIEFLNAKNANEKTKWVEIMSKTKKMKLD